MIDTIARRNSRFDASLKDSHLLPERGVAMPIFNRDDARTHATLNLLSVCYHFRRIKRVPAFVGPD
jgi:hypothetical protein